MRQETVYVRLDNINVVLDCHSPFTGYKLIAFQWMDDATGLPAEAKPIDAMRKILSPRIEEGHQVDMTTSGKVKALASCDVKIASHLIQLQFPDYPTGVKWPSESFLSFGQTVRGHGIHLRDHILEDEMGYRVVLFPEVRIHILHVIEVGLLTLVHLPPSVDLLQFSETELTSGVQDISTDCVAGRGHCQVQVDPQFRVHVIVRNELEDEPTLQVVLQFHVDDIDDESTAQDGHWKEED